MAMSKIRNERDTSSFWFMLIILIYWTKS